MLKGILKYSIAALWVIIAELFPSIVWFDKFVMATDSSYLLIDKHANDTTITEVSSLSELPIDVQHESLRHQNAYRFGVICTGYGSGIFSVQKNMVRR